MSIGFPQNSGERWRVMANLAVDCHGPRAFNSAAVNGRFFFLPLVFSPVMSTHGVLGIGRADRTEFLTGRPRSGPCVPKSQVHHAGIEATAKGAAAPAPAARPAQTSRAGTIAGSAPRL